MPVTREELYQQAWAEPMTKIAARYDVSSSFLASVYDRLNVPRPPNGYWSQLRVGKTVSKPELPPAKPGDELGWSPGEAPRRKPRRLPKAKPALLRQRESAGERPALHEVLVGAREHFEKSRVTEEGYLKPFKRLVVDVFTSKDQIDKALSFANDFFQQLEDRRHSVVLAQGYYRPDLDVRENGKTKGRVPLKWSPSRPTVVFIGKVAVGLSLYEMTEQVEFRYVKGKYVRVDSIPPSKRAQYEHEWGWNSMQDVGSGRFALRAYCPRYGISWDKEWKESKAGELTSKIRSIVRELEKAAPAIAELVKEADRNAEIEHKRWQERMLQLEREEAERRRLQALNLSREELLRIIEQWALATRIERFFESVAAPAAGLQEEERATLLERLDRARALFGGPDALGWFRKWKMPEER
jgi:hypothetical protein